MFQRVKHKQEDLDDSRNWVIWDYKSDNDYNDYLQKIAYSLIELSGRSIVLNTGVTRGLDYYEGKGFEIACDELGSSKAEERDRNPSARKKYIDSIVLIYKSKNYMSLVHRIHLMTDAENNTYLFLIPLNCMNTFELYEYQLFTKEPIEQALRSWYITSC